MLPAYTEDKIQIPYHGLWDSTSLTTCQLCDPTTYDFSSLYQLKKKKMSQVFAMLKAFVMFSLPLPPVPYMAHFSHPPWQFLSDIYPDNCSTINYISIHVFSISITWLSFIFAISHATVLWDASFSVYVVLPLSKISSMRPERLYSILFLKTVQPLVGIQ